MKPTFISLAALLIVCTPGSISPKNIPGPHNGFKLELTETGFGSNYYEMMPMFRVKGTKFVYSIEDAWQWPDRPIQRDTICTGVLRTTSVDSIISLVESIPDTSIYVSGRFMSGSSQGLVITTPRKKLGITMFNSYEPTADKIVAILNSNLPPGVNPLYVSGINKNKRN